MSATSRIDVQVVEADRSSNMAEEYVSVSEALKLVTPFSGNKREVLTFIANVNTAFEAINPDHEGRLCKFVLTRISGEPRTAIDQRNLDSWVEVREFLRNTFLEKRTLDFHANQLFQAKQGKTESVSEWVQNIQTLGSKFREVALMDCAEEERAGILTLSDKLRNICFVQGLLSDRIQTIVRSRNHDHFDDIAETALEEESAIISKAERYKAPDSNPVQCTVCKKSGHTSNRCFSKLKRENRVNQFSARRQPQQKEFICFNCGEKGHISRNCRKPRKSSGQGNQRSEMSGNEKGPLARSRQTVSTLQ